MLVLYTEEDCGPHFSDFGDDCPENRDAIHWIAGYIESIGGYSEIIDLDESIYR